MVQQPSKMAHAREQWPGMARLNRDRTILSRGSHLVRPSLPGLHSFLRAFRRSPLGVWVGEGLKEEIAGERGFGPDGSFGKFFKKLDGAIHFAFPEISAEMCAG